MSRSWGRVEEKGEEGEMKNDLPPPTIS